MAHILLKFPENASDDVKAKLKPRIDSIYAQINKGTMNWDSAVAKYSEDRTSKNKKGELQWFGVGRMMPEFEETSYGLKKDGDISKPIKTNYGWHIIKRLEKREIPPFTEVKGDFKKRVERDSRSSVAKTKLVERIKRENNFSENAANKKDFFKALDSTSVSSGIRKDSIKYSKDLPLFTLAGKAPYNPRVWPVPGACEQAP